MKLGNCFKKSWTNFNAKLPSINFISEFELNSKLETFIDMKSSLYRYNITSNVSLNKI